MDGPNTNKCESCLYSFSNGLFNHFKQLFCLNNYLDTYLAHTTAYQCFVNRKSAKLLALLLLLLLQLLLLKKLLHQLLFQAAVVAAVAAAAAS